MRLIFTALALATLSFGTGCTRSGSESASPSSEERGATMDAAEAAPISKADIVIPMPRVERQLIKTGRFTLRVHGYDEAITAFRDTVARFDAYIAGEREERRTYRIENTVTVRVAAPQFDSFVEALSHIEGTVEARTIDVSDVTEEYVDTEARLRSRRAAEERYLEIMQRATTLEDILAVQRQLDQVREEIERVEGRLRFLRDQVGFSTIAVTIYQETESALTEGLGFFSQAKEALGVGWRATLDLLLFVLVTWPLLLAIALGVLVYLRWQRPRQPRTRPTRPHAPRTEPPPLGEAPRP